MIPPTGSNLLRDEGGVSMVMFALWLPVLLLVVVFVIDVGNWFAHRRHLQLQADASALAAAGEVTFPCDDGAISETAHFYSGEGSDGYNHQLGGTSSDKVHLELNSSTYYNQNDPTDETAVEGSPCEAGMVDVKLTETDLPLFFQVVDAFDLVDFINAHARVEFFATERESILPLGVSDNNPVAARATFVNETTGQVIASRALTRNGTENALAIWDNQSDPLPVEVNASQIGVRVHLSGQASTTCGDPLVECYDPQSANGLVYIRGYSNAGTGQQPNPPLARGVTLLPGSCPDPYFVSRTSNCTIGLRAILDFGPCQDILPVIDVGAVITARVGNSDHVLQFESCPIGGTTSEWRTNGSPITVQPGQGPVPITLDWEEKQGAVGGETCRVTGNNPCRGTFGVVQRAFGGSDIRSGSIRSAQILKDGSAGANSLERCSEIQTNCRHDLVVRIGIDPGFENAESKDEPPVKLRIARGETPSQTQSFDCDQGRNLKQELAEGCRGRYERNRGTPCPDDTEPWNCVPVAPGQHMNDVWSGMNLRVHGSDPPERCVNQNRWRDDFPRFDRSDPRLVPVFLTPFGAFRTSGSSYTVPISNFGTFYITGWAGAGAGMKSNLIPGCEEDDPAEPGTLVGHFIKYIQPINDGTAGEERCDPAGIESCVPVLTH